MADTVVEAKEETKAVEDRGDVVTETEETKEAEVKEAEVIEQEKEIEKKDEEELSEEALKKIIGEDETDKIDKPSSSIPSSRLKQEADKRRAAEAELEIARAELDEIKKKGTREAPKVPQASYDYNKAEEEYINAAVSGDNETAIRIRNEINSNLKKDFDKGIYEILDDIGHKNKTQTGLQAIADESYKDYPFLDIDSEQANNELIDKIVLERNELAKLGMSIDLALDKALKIYKPEIEEYKKSLDEKEEKGNVDVENEGKVKNIEDERKRLAVKRNIETSNKQPPKLKMGTGDKGSKFNAMNISEKDFDSLPEIEKKRMRGDVV